MIKFPVASEARLHRALRLLQRAKLHLAQTGFHFIKMKWIDADRAEAFVIMDKLEIKLAKPGRGSYKAQA